MVRKLSSTGAVEVKVIQTIESVPNRDATVYFTDGTRAVVKKANKTLLDMLQQPESVAPNLIKVTLSKGIITDAERVDTDPVGE